MGPLFKSFTEYLPFHDGLWKRRHFTNYFNAPFSVIRGTLGLARHNGFVQDVSVPPVQVPPVTLAVIFFVCAVEASNCSHCLHDQFAPATFVSFDITAKKENAVRMWEEIPSLVLFVEQLRVSEELSFHYKLKA